MPFIPYIVGAAIGAAITYVARDDSSKEMIKDTGGKVTSSVGAMVGKVTGMFKKNTKEATEEVAEVVEATDEKEEAAVPA